MALEWSGQEEFNGAEDVLWTSKLTGREAGEFRMAGNFAFLRVYEAGHMVPYDQPEHSLEFINMFLHGHGRHGSDDDQVDDHQDKKKVVPKPSRGGIRRKNEKKGI